MAAEAASPSTMGRQKMEKLPAGAKVNKRPLHRPAIPSPYTSSREAKVVYVSTKTPFMSAIKRVDKLLRLAEKRSIQSATALVRDHDSRKRQRLNNDKATNISSIVQHMQEQPQREEVIVKATGKAIVKALDIGCWFQQRPEYIVRLETNTVESIDDIEIDEPDGEAAQSQAVSSTDVMSVDATPDTANAADSAEGGAKQKKPPWIDNPNQRDEVRTRLLSVMEILITLK